MNDFRPIKVAVLGSCVSRDNFNSLFNPSHKDLFELVAAQNHVSLVSLMSTPVKVAPEDLGKLKPRILSDLKREFSRSFLEEIRASKPEYLIIDFWPDVIYGFADLGHGDVVTHNSWATVKTPFFAARAAKRYRLDLTQGEFLQRWRPAADAFFEFMDAHLPHTKVLLHKARNVSTFKAIDGTTKEFNTWPVRMNKYWEKLDNYFEERHGCRTIDVMEEGQESFEAHPWGKLPVHYTLDYYPRFLSHLIRHVMGDLSSSLAKARSIDLG